MKKLVFEGSAVALVTPFKNNVVDYDAFGKMIDFQINNKTDAIVVCGTTGESSTLTDEEHKEAIKFAVEKIAGRVPVIAGTGSNDAAYAQSHAYWRSDQPLSSLSLCTNWLKHLS